MEAIPKILPRTAEYCNLTDSLHTERSLLLAMEGAGLGTAETRAPVIESLVSCGYIERREQALIPSEKGQVVYNCVKDMRIADVQQAEVSFFYGQRYRPAPLG